jgi:hypothetical protein
MAGRWIWLLFHTMKRQEFEQLKKKLKQMEKDFREFDPPL